MAVIERLVKTSNLKLKKITDKIIEKKNVLYLRYDELADTLILLWVRPDTETVVHYIDEHVSLLYEPGKKEVVGIQIEDFEDSFLKAYGNVARVWRLSDACNELQDYGDLALLFEQRKPVVAGEIGKVTDELIWSHKGNEVLA